MRRRAFLADPAPEGAEVHGNIKLYPHGKDGEFLCKAWRGKQSKPYAFYTFRTAQARAEWMQEQRDGADAHRKFKAEETAAQSKALAKMREQLQVGTILHTSWGYDQTNVEFFEVVERKPASVVVREISSDLEETAFMQGRRTPCPGEYIGPPMLRRISPTGVKIDDVRYAWPTEPGKAIGCSWYA
jgi:hypothetical protein